MSIVPIGHESFQSTNSHRFTFYTADAAAFTLCLLRTYTTTNCRQRTGLLNDLISSFKILFKDVVVQKAKAYVALRSKDRSVIFVARAYFGEIENTGIYPCGEGAGYAGGITSAAMDGLKVAEKIAQKFAPFDER